MEGAGTGAQPPLNAPSCAEGASPMKGRRAGKDSSPVFVAQSRMTDQAPQALEVNSCQCM